MRRSRKSNYGRNVRVRRAPIHFINPYLQQVSNKFPTIRRPIKFLNTETKMDEEIKKSMANSDWLRNWYRLSIKNQADAAKQLEINRRVEREMRAEYERLHGRPAPPLPGQQQQQQRQQGGKMDFSELKKKIIPGVGEENPEMYKHRLLLQMMNNPTSNQFLSMNKYDTLGTITKQEEAAEEKRVNELYNQKLIRDAQKRVLDAKKAIQYLSEHNEQGGIPRVIQVTNLAPELQEQYLDNVMRNADEDLKKQLLNGMNLYKAAHLNDILTGKTGKTNNDNNEDEDDEDGKIEDDKTAIDKEKEEKEKLKKEYREAQSQTRGMAPPEDMVKRAIPDTAKPVKITTPNIGFGFKTPITISTYSIEPIRF